MQAIKDYLANFNLDIRESGDARFMDQKCTPDVISIIADCVINFVGNNHDKTFTVNDIWNSQYFIKTVSNIFKKPEANNPTVEHEYDKFIAQPLRTLAYSHVLNIEKSGVTNLYSIAEYDILEYISLKDRNAYLFLCEYLEKVLIDSGIYSSFENYKNLYLGHKLDTAAFNTLKEKFQRFIIGNTKINGYVEVNRIFPKILNIYAVQNNLPGTIKGFLSKFEFSYSDLMYNRKNWRDVKKDKKISRQEAEAEYNLLNLESKNYYDDYLIQKAMNQIRKMYTESEVRDQWSIGEATQIHHIFPKQKFPQIAHYLENLIKLNATQHYTKAHPSNKTNSINIDYQLVCLLAKSDSIERSLQINQPYYRKESFIYCINTGLSAELKYDLTFKQIKAELATIYNNL
jgi:hypothetical protein